MNSRLTWPCTAAVLAIIGLIAGAPAIAAGVAFSDPELTSTMPEEWQARKLAQGAWAGSAKLAVTLGQDLYPAFEPMVREFAAREGIEIAVKEGTCGVSAGMLKRKEVDVAGFCCPPSRTDRLPGVRFHTLGIGAVSLLVNAVNPIENVRISSARGIFEGKIKVWNAVQSTASPQKKVIKTVGRLHCQARPGHWHLLLESSADFSASLLEVEAPQDMIAGVARFENSIGFETPWSVERYEGGEQIKQVTVDEVGFRDLEAIAAGRYPIYRTYNVTTWEGSVNPYAIRLVEYLLRRTEERYEELHLVPPSMLRRHGWRFHGDELVGEPDEAASRR